MKIGLEEVLNTIIFQPFVVGFWHEYNLHKYDITHVVSYVCKGTSLI